MLTTGQVRSPCACLPDGIALGPDGDAQAPIPSAPNTTNKVHARLNTFDMFTSRTAIPFSRCDRAQWPVPIRLTCHE